MLNLDKLVLNSTRLRGNRFGIYNKQIVFYRKAKINHFPKYKIVKKLRSMTKLSLCMIVKNEEKNLTTCLESVQDIVDEMVVMDTGSTDKTVEIARKFGAKVPIFTWCNNFATARNAALNHVTGDWVLILDADEVFNQKIISQIREAIADKNNLVINLVRHEIGASQSPYSLVSRLFRKHPAVEFSRPYHAIIDDSVTELLKRESQWKIMELPAIAVFHYGYHTIFNSVYKTQIKLVGVRA